MRGPKFTRDRLKTAAERLANEREHRMRLVARQIPYGISFLDDCLRSILPTDLILVGASTGVGKTELALMLAESAIARGRRVDLLALEAEEGEVEQRIKYRRLVDYAYTHNLPGREKLLYPDWWRGACDEILRSPTHGDLEAVCEESLREAYRNLRTLYRGRDFNEAQLEQTLLSVQDETDLIILDHLHYVDLDGDTSENRAMKGLVKRIRDVVLKTETPVVCMAHLRKHSAGRKTIFPTIEDFMGSSDIVKVATTVILLGPAYDEPRDRAHLAPTFIEVVKDRRGGASRLTGLLEFDMHKNRYRREYVLGRIPRMGDRFNDIEPNEAPRWAKHARWRTN